MKCDLCGNKVKDNLVYSYEDVEGSKLCRSCYDAITGVKETEANESSFYKAEEHEKASSTKNAHDETSDTELLLIRCKSCSATFEYSEDCCPSCGHRVLSNHVVNNGHRNSVIKLTYIIFIAAILCIVPFAIKGAVIPLIMFGPSIIAVSIAIFAWIKTTKFISRVALTLLAMALHGVSSIFTFAAVGIGEAWGGYSRSHNFPKVYAWFGAVIIIFILLIPQYEEDEQPLRTNKETENN